MSVKKRRTGPQNREFPVDILGQSIKEILGRSCITLAIGITAVTSADALAAPSVIQLSDLDGSDGFVIHGLDDYDYSGFSVSEAGDFNGDGFDDFIVGAHGGDPSGKSAAGESYLVFGSANVGASGTFDPSTLDGTNGFLIEGVDNIDQSGKAVGGGQDFNGDGFSDLIVGAFSADPNGQNYAGEVYVVFGGSNVGTSGVVELEDLDGSNGFTINGIDANDRLGLAMNGAGDVNGDGFQDLIMGSYKANGGAGESYVVFGKSDIGNSGELNLTDLDGSNGFIIEGIDAEDKSGESVSSAGDFNDDGIDDLLIGAHLADPNGGLNGGESYVLFGDTAIGAGGTVELAQIGSGNGVTINGGIDYARAGVSVSSVGDNNGDGVDDLIIGAYGEQKSYVVFGGSYTTNIGVINLSSLDGTNGYEIDDDTEYSGFFGFSVDGAGDFDGDGVADVVIGAASAGPIFGSNPGKGYIVMGGSAVGSSGLVNFSAMEENDGIMIYGVDAGDGAGRSVSRAGDINGDGLSDIVIGARLADGVNNSLSRSGDSYIVFGREPVCNGLTVTVDLNLGQTPGPGNDVVLGTPGDDVIRGRAGNDTICGMGGDDYIHGNSGDDWINGGDGVDNIRGGQGADTLYSGSGATVGTSSRVFGGNGDDSIFGGDDADDLRGGKGDDVIDGGAGDDLLSGNNDDDELYGGVDNDVLKGGGGENDELYGEDGVDDLNGGSGSNDLCDGGGQSGDVDSNCEI